MKKYLYLLVLLACCVLFGINNTFAYHMREMSPVDFNQFMGSTSQGDPADLYFQSKNGYNGYGAYTFYVYNSNLTQINQNISFHGGQSFGVNGVLNLNDPNSKSPNHFSNVYFQEDGQGGRNFYRRSETQLNWLVYNVGSRAGFVYTFPDGNVATMDNVYFRHNSIIFQSSSTLDTVQFINDGGYGNRVFYCDPQDNGQNFYMIDFKHHKAWSMKQTKNFCFNAMYGLVKFTPVVLNNLNFEYSYTLSQGGVNFFPTTAGYVQGPQKNAGASDNLGWIYSQDIEFIEPTYGGSGSTGGGSSTGVVVPDTSFQNQNLTYNKCIDQYNFYNAIANAQDQCRSDYSNYGKLTPEQFIAVQNYVISPDYILHDRNNTGVIPDTSGSIGCTLYIENARSYAYYYFVSQSGSIIDSDYVNVITDIKNKTSRDPYNLQALCGSKPTGPLNDDGTPDYECNMNSWANFINCFSAGSSSTSTGDDNSMFETATNNFTTMISSSFEKKFISPIKREFDQGRAKIGNVDCSNNVLFSLPQNTANLLVYLFALLLFFILYKLL